MLEDTRATDLSRLVGTYQRARIRSCAGGCAGHSRGSRTRRASTCCSTRCTRTRARGFRQEAAFALGQIGSRQATQALVYAAREQKDRRVRARALEALGKIGDPEGRGVVTGHLTNPDPELSREAALACWRMSDSTAGAVPGDRREEQGRADAGVRRLRDGEDAAAAGDPEGARGG
jgi:HEAT repeat protein